MISQVYQGIGLNAQLLRLPAMRSFQLPKNIQLSVPQKVTVVSMTVGLALLGFLARYFRRKRHGVGPPTSEEETSGSVRGSAKGKGRDSCRASGGRGSVYKSRSPNGDRRPLNRQPSSSVSVASAVSSAIAVDTNLSPQQLGVMGMEALQTAISYWEDAIKSYGCRVGPVGDSAAKPLPVTTAEEAEFSKELDNLLESAYKVQYECELLFLDQRSVLFRDDASSVREWVTAGATRGSESSSRRTIASPTESFASAQDQVSPGAGKYHWNNMVKMQLETLFFPLEMPILPDALQPTLLKVADLREFEAFTEVFPDYENLPLYKAALKHLETDGIPCRCLRTEAVNCSSNAEYLAKLYCIRLAFQLLFRQPTTWVWFADTGQQILMDLLLFADKDSKGFLMAYEDMLSFLRSLGVRDETPQGNGSSNTCTWTDVEEELASRGVKAMTFFDVVLDYILLDAFDDLDQPPSSVTAVVQNRWLSSGFKETALATAVWSLLRAKRHRLTQPNGFMAHFYAISEHISPLMAWGFLGSDEELTKMCLYFKEQVMGFLQDVFSFERTRFTTVEELAVDVMAHARSRADGITETLSTPVKAKEDPVVDDFIANISISNGTS